ncbi:MAG: tetratricopeptide repeat protein [Bacteroidales bacterium]
MTRTRAAILIILNTLFIVNLTLGQETKIYTEPDATFRKAFDLYQKEMYAGAQKLFEQYIEASNKSVNHLNTEAEFYRAMCAIELDNNDAEYLIGTFINNHPESQKIDLAHFAMGKMQYQQKKYPNSIYWLQKIDKNGISREKQYEMQFMLGYCYFMANDLEAANKWFYQVKDVDNKFAAPATYYYSHIAYLQGKYATALKGFEKLNSDPTFAPIVPFYISQIYYLQGDFKKVVDYSPPLLKDNTTKRTPEIARIIGDSYFKLKQYDSALFYLGKYADKTPQLSRDDYYLVGFAYYKNRKYDEAAGHLERVSTSEDSISQNAYYHLADCYLQLNDKAKARQAFGMASKLDFDGIIKEDALFNFAKITYEQLYAPFNEAIEAFQKYIELYPNTPRTDEAYNFLTLAYLNTKNYKEAVESLNKIKNKDATIKAAYQKAAHFRALELFQNINFNEAVDMFNLSLQYSAYNQSIAAQSLYWQAEAYYRLENFSKAAEGYNRFILTPGAFNLPEYNMAHYNLGYCQFKLKNYDEAIVWFRKFTSLCNNEKTVHVGDAYNRIGDSFFIQRKYWAAIDYYDQSISVNTIDADYAAFQRGFCLGLVERPQKKIESLQNLLKSYPSSSYVDDAIFELAESYMVMNQTSDAKGYYQKIERNYTGSSYYVKALVQLGLIYNNTENPDSAMQYYKRVVEGYPGTLEAKNALIGIRNIYVDKGDAPAYFEYASKLGSIANMSVAEKDSLTYMAAEKLYINGDCEKSNQAFTGYLRDFPQGNFLMHSYYYLGDCYNRLNNTDAAMEAFSKVIAMPKNNFTEQSLLQLGKIYFDRAMYEDCYQTYDKLESVAELKTSLLEARIGKLRSAYMLKNYRDIPPIASSVLSNEKLPVEIELETRFKLGQALQELGNADDALIEFAKVAANVKTKEGAESKYMVAKIYLQKGDLKKAEAEVFAFAEKNTPHQYWLAKSFILLADVYIQQDDFFQAKATLQSVIDGYSITDDGIIDGATDKLNQLVKIEKGKQTKQTNDNLSIDVK